MVAIAVILGLVVAFCFGTSDFLSKGLGQKVGFYRATVYTLAMSGGLVFLPALLLGAPKQPSLLGIAVLGLIAVATFTAFVFMYRGYQKGHLSIVSPTVNSFPVFLVLISIFILKVSISTTVLLALAGVILGIVLVSTNFSSLRSSKRVSLTVGVPEAILAAFFFAVTFSSIGYAYETIGYFLPVLAARIGAAFVGLLLGLALKIDVRPFGGKLLPRLLLMGALEAAGILIFSLAILYSSIAMLPITTTLMGMGVVFTVGFALIFLKERVEASYAVGVMVLIVSVAALLYFTA
jgi:drug/metabolite transporter (DMT)-like permease